MTNKTPRIILTGKLRSGKSTVSTYLANEYGFHVMAFGDVLKRTADELFVGSDVYKFERIGTDEFTPICRKPRRLYQDYGTALRALDPNVWIRQVERSLPVWENMRSVNGIVVDDLRQLNEEKWAKANGFTVIRINADEDTRLRRATEAGDTFSADDLRHATEHHVDNVEADYDVWNDGEGTDGLERKIDEIMAEILSA